MATTFQGAETIKRGHGVYKVGWSLQSRHHATGPRSTASNGEVEALLLPAVMRYNAPVTAARLVVMAPSATGGGTGLGDGAAATVESFLRP